MATFFHLYLASASPRRRELLRQIGISFELLKVDVPEIPQAGESPQDFVQRVALEKARAGKACLAVDDPHPVLAADTAVIVGEEILGKPGDAAHAKAMLGRLSGRTHEVMSAVALVGERQEVRLNVTRVTFRPLSAKEIDDYWETGESVDKAGAYAIQGRAAVFISNINGSYSGVMGLPLFEVATLLREFGIDPLR